MVEMKMTKEDAKKRYGEPSMIGDAPEYPYGLRIDLDDSSMEKLGIDKLPEVGSTMMIMARVEVCCASESKSYSGETNRNVALQITEMQIGADSDKSDKAKELYG